MDSNLKQSSASVGYMPGVCNINPIEVRRRRSLGRVGMLLSVLYLMFAIAMKLDFWLGSGLGLPVFLAAIGYLQARNSFCVAYALNKMENATPGNISASKVGSLEHNQRDKKRASKIILQSFLIALLAAVVLTGVLYIYK